jgi:hypothetical protein
LSRGFVKDNVNTTWSVGLNRWDFFSDGQLVDQNLSISFCAATTCTTAISSSSLRSFPTDDGSHLSGFGSGVCQLSSLITHPFIGS